jgi:hypothetical protein
MTITTDLVGLGYMLSIVADKANLVDLSDSTPLKDQTATVAELVNALDDLDTHVHIIYERLAAALENGAE